MLRRFMRTRGARKFKKNRTALVATAVIGVYFVAALAILFFDVVTVDDTVQRVGPSAVPGFFAEATPEKRLADAESHLARVDTALGASEPESALSEIAYAERELASTDPEVVAPLVARGLAAVDELGRVDDLDTQPELWPELARLEALADELFAPLEGWDSFVYDARLILGTDRQGRSISFRALYAVKIAVQIGVVTSLISVLLGGVLGAAAGFLGGWVDAFVIWLYSTFSSIPYLVLLVVVAYIFQGGPYDATLLPVYVAFCTTFWIGTCRVVRGEALKLKELEYVQAATAVGFGRWYILLKHVLPNTAHLMFINFSLIFIGAIKSEVILSFLGLGVKSGSSWGIMISQSRHEVINGFFWQIGAATAFMFGLVLAFNVFTDALQDALDPKHVQS